MYLKAFDLGQVPGGLTMVVGGVTCEQLTGGHGSGSGSNGLGLRVKGSGFRV